MTHKDPMWRELPSRVPTLVDHVHVPARCRRQRILGLIHRGLKEYCRYGGSRPGGGREPVAWVLFKRRR